MSVSSSAAARDTLVGPALGVRPILCAIDATPAARSASALAGALAARAGSAIVLVHALSPSYQREGWDPMPAVRGITEAQRRTGVELLGEHSRALTHRIVAQHQVLSGDPAAAVIDAATTHRAALVVAGTGRPGRLRRLLHGSVSTRLTASAPCPVVIVSAPWTGDVLSDGPLLHAFRPRATTGEVAAARAAAADVGLRPVFTPTTQRRRTDTILDAAHHVRAAMIAIGSSGRGPASSALLGALDLDLITRSPYPVLVLPRQGTAA